MYIYINIQCGVSPVYSRSVLNPEQMLVQIYKCGLLI